MSILAMAKFYQDIIANGGTIRTHSRADVIQPGTYGCYWTSRMYNEVQAYFLGFGTSTVYPVDVTDTCYGQPIRPVFSIRFTESR